MTNELPVADLPPGVVLLDGGIGQELRRRSPAGDGPLWSAQVLIDAPEIVLAVHGDFIRAGARIITTNSYATTRPRMTVAGIGDRVGELNRAAGELARRARDTCGEAVLIAGSLPPLYGSYRPEQVRPFAEIEPLYREQAEVLAPHVDLFICETMSSADEARAAATAAAATGKPVWVAWTVEDSVEHFEFDRHRPAPPPGHPQRTIPLGGRVGERAGADSTQVGIALADTNSRRLRSGETIAEAARALDGLPVSAFLANCSWPESIGAAIPELVGLGDFPAGGYANGFSAIPEGWQVIEGTARLGARRDLDPEAYAGHVQSWIAAGARIVGGCCEVGPAHIARLRELIGS